MNLKQPDELVGLRQIVNGFIGMPRIRILDLIKTKKISPTELGYYVIFLISADWDSSPKRKGSIRFPATDLEKIWGLSHSSFSKILKRLTEIDLLRIDKNSIYWIVDYTSFTVPIAKRDAKSFHMSDQQIQAYFPFLDAASTILETLQTNSDKPFSVPSKVNNLTDDEIMDALNPKTLEYYQRLKEKNPSLPSPEDMMTIDEILAEH